MPPPNPSHESKLESQSPTGKGPKDALVPFRVQFDVDDPENPRNFSSTYKSWLVFQMSMLAMIGALGSSILAPAEAAIAKYTNVSNEVTALTVALFVLGWAFGPMIWGPISEVYGRRVGMLPAVFILGLFSIGTATSKNAESVFITRFFGGVFASAPISNVPAALGDMFDPATRGNVMTFVALCISGGPTIGPIIGAALTLNPSLGWRWTEYLEAILVFFLFVLCTFCLPETYAPVILGKKARKLRKVTGENRYWHPHEQEKIDIHNAFTKHLARPLRMLVTEPIVTYLALYASFAYSLIYLTLEVFPIVFKERRQWTLATSTLPFLAILIGIQFAVLINFVNSFFYKRVLQGNGDRAVPEARLPPIFVGGILLSAGLFWFGWTAAPEYHWALPVVAAGFIGAGFNVVFQQCLNFLVDTYGIYAASAVSANTILRSLLACAMPIAARPMFEDLGIGPASSLLGGISCLALLIPFLLMKCGATLRKKSRFVPREV